MGGQEVVTWEVFCDYCRKTEIVTSKESRGGPVSQRHPLPRGWMYHEVRGCGMTGYTRRDELCPDCYNETVCKGR